MAEQLSVLLSRDHIMALFAMGEVRLHVADPPGHEPASNLVLRLILDANAIDLVGELTKITLDAAAAAAAATERAHRRRICEIITVPVEDRDR